MALAFLAQAAVVPALADAAEIAAQRLQEPLAARWRYWMTTSPRLPPRQPPTGTLTRPAPSSADGAPCKLGSARRPIPKENPAMALRRAGPLVMGPIGPRQAS